MMRIPLVATKVFSDKDKNICWIVIDDEVKHISIVWMTKELQNKYEKIVEKKVKEMMKAVKGYDYYPDLQISAITEKGLKKFLRKET